MSNKFGATPDVKRETIRQAGMRYVKYLGNRRHLIYNPGKLYHSAYEVWRTNRDGIGYGVVYKNSALQFERPALNRTAPLG